MNNILNERIMSLLKERKITQKILANEIHVTQATLSRNLNGIHKPKVEILKKIADFFNVSTDYLLGNDDDKNTHNVYNVDDIFYNQHGITTNEQREEIETFIKFIKEKTSK